jgi:hypothetical protein
MNVKKVSTAQLKKVWNKYKNEERPAPVFAQQLKRTAAELKRRGEKLEENKMFKFDTYVRGIMESVKLVKENTNNKSKRIPYNDIMIGPVTLHSYEFRIPSEYFPEDVLLKYSQYTGQSLEEMKEDGVIFDDVEFDAEEEVGGGQAYAGYNGPSISYGYDPTYLSGLELNSWRLRDQQEDNVFTTSQGDQDKMDSIITDYLEKHIDSNIDKFEEQIKDNNSY